MEEVEEVLELMYDLIHGNGDKETINILLQEGNIRKQDAQGDWAKDDKSTKFYKEINQGVERETHWDRIEINGLTKKQWARLRYGNIGKKAKKGYVN